MAAFDRHETCARCRDKKLGSDDCVLGKDCQICESLMDSPQKILATPQYQIRRDKKSGVLVSPRKLTVVGPVESLEEDSSDQDSAHAQLPAGPSHAPYSMSQSSGRDFVSRQDFDILNNQLEEKFAHFEALLTSTNIISTSKVAVAVTNPPVLLEMPFINPDDPRAICLVWPPGQDATVKPNEKKVKGVGKAKDKKKCLISLHLSLSLPVNF